MFDSDRALLGAFGDCLRESMNLMSNLHQQDVEQRTRNLAYSLWENAGRPDGRADDFWFAAEEILLGNVIGEEAA